MDQKIFVSMWIVVVLMSLRSKTLGRGLSEGLISVQLLIDLLQDKEIFMIIKTEKENQQQVSPTEN